MILREVSSGIATPHAISRSGLPSTNGGGAGWQPEPASLMLGEGQRVYYKQAPKCTNIGNMPEKSKRLFFLALLLVGVLLAAQLHCCVDLSSRALDSHVCPICSAAATAVPTPSLIVEMAPAVDRLEVSGVVVFFPLVVPRSIAPRAPPAA
jgi:hypothetical protein